MKNLISIFIEPIKAPFPCISNSKKENHEKYIDYNSNINEWSTHRSNFSNWKSNR